MDSDNMKKYSDKLFFTLMSGGDLDDEDLQEITNHMLAEDAKKKERAKEDGTVWTIAHDKKDVLRLLPGEYPRLFNKKMKKGEEDKFSENVFNVSDSKGTPALFVPTPSSLMLGDLLRANREAQKPLKVEDTLFSKNKAKETEMRYLYDDEDENASDETFENVEDLIRENLDFSGFRAPEVSVKPAEEPPRAEENLPEPTLVETLVEFGTNVAAVGALLTDTFIGLGKELVQRYWLSKKRNNNDE